MRCPDCQKFVSYDTEVDPEEQSPIEIAAAGEITGEWRRVLCCSECGTELKEATLSLEDIIDVPEICQLPVGADGLQPTPHEEHAWEVTESSASPTERVESKDRKGKPIKSARYMKTFYGVEVEVTAKCSNCEAVIKSTFNIDEQASAFDEM